MTVQGDRISVFHRVIVNREIVGTVYLEADFEVYDRARSYLAVILVVSLFALGVSSLLSYFFQRSATRPILDIADVARRVVEARDYSMRARRTTEDEIGTLADAFNDMLAQIDAAPRTWNPQREVDGSRAT